MGGRGSRGGSASGAVPSGDVFFAFVFSLTFIVKTQNHEEHEISNGSNNSSSKCSPSTTLKGAGQTRAHAINAVPGKEKEMNIFEVKGCFMTGNKEETSKR